MEVWESTKNQNLPAGFEVEWIVQEDGPNPQLETILPSDRRISYAANNRQYGAATTRNLGLARATGMWVMSLDEDDTLTESAISLLLKPLRIGSHRGWSCGAAEKFDDTTGQVLEVLRPDFPAGYVAAGVPYDRWVATGRFPVLASHVLYPMDKVRAVGGWPAQARSEDAGLLLAISRDNAGWVDHHVVLKYRSHDHQNTKQAWNIAVREQVALTMRMAYGPLSK